MIQEYLTFDIDGNPYIYFRLVEEKPKTQVWSVVNKSQGYTLGNIMWYSPWRQYVFEPQGNMVFNTICLDTINNFIKRLNKERRIVKGENHV
jgi:hypothetical protein